MTPSVDMQKQFDELAEKSANAELTRREKKELDQYIALERLIRQAKIRAQPGSTPS